MCCLFAELEHGCTVCVCAVYGAMHSLCGVVAHTLVHMVHCVRCIVVYFTLYVARRCCTSHSFAAPRTCIPHCWSRAAGSDYNATSCNGKATRTQRIIHLATHHAAQERARYTAAFSKQHTATLFGALATHALLTHALLTHALVLPSAHRALVPPITRYCDSSKGINLLSQARVTLPH